MLSHDLSIFNRLVASLNYLITKEPLNTFIEGDTLIYGLTSNVLDVTAILEISLKDLSSY